MCSLNQPVPEEIARTVEKCPSSLAHIDTSYRSLLRGDSSEATAPALGYDCVVHKVRRTSRNRLHDEGTVGFSWHMKKAHRIKAFSEISR